MVKKYLLLIACLMGGSLAISQEISVFFIGNSLTYTNDLPEIIAQIGRMSGTKLRVKSHCLPNYSLEDHWSEGIVQDMIEGDMYDFVVFQQGPSSRPEGRDMLFFYGGSISDLSRKYGAVPVFFMVWPSVQYWDSFDGVIQNYTDASIESHAKLAPAGLVWKELLAEYPVHLLYARDRFHPGQAGSFLSALVIFHCLFPEVDITGLSYARCRKWVSDKRIFERMIELATQISE